MTVPADSAKDQVQTATTGLVNLRESGRWVGGSHVYDGGEQLVTGWHFHDVHEIEYACRGVVEVKTEAGHYLLPPHQAAWIPAGLQVVAKLPAACPCASFHGPAVPAGPFRPRGVHRCGFRRRRGVRPIVRQALRGDPLRLQTTNQWNTLNRPQLPRQLPTAAPAAHPRWTRGPHLKCEEPASNHPQVLTIARHRGCISGGGRSSDRWAH